MERSACATIPFPRGVSPNLHKKCSLNHRLRSSLRLRRVGCVDSLDNRIPIELLHHATALSSSILRETGSGFKRARDASPSGLASLPDCFFL